MGFQARRGLLDTIAGRLRAAEDSLARHVRHVAAGQRFHRALQADLLAYAGFQGNALRRGHVAANHTPTIKDDVGGRPACVGKIAV
jgi:hypothetical protein